MTVPRPSLRSPRRIIARTAGLAGVSLLAASLLAWAPQTATGWNQSSAEGTLWQLMNGARINNGRSPVQQHSTLVSLARWRSKDQVDRNYFSHDVLGTGYQVYHWYDLNGLNYSWGGENIGWNNGYSDADSPVKIHEGFMNSPGHRANVLEPSFTHGGVGAYAKDNVQFLGKLRSPRFYTQLFMTAASAPPPPPPPPSSNPPPPPPSGGGSGGASRPATPAAPAAAATPSAKTLRVDAPAAPTPSAPLEATNLLVAAHAAPSTAAVRAMAWSDPAAERPAATAAAPQAASTMRVATPAAAEHGLFESVLGSFLGFILG